MQKRVLIISDGIPGHVNQSRGIVTLLKKKYKIFTSEVELESKIYFLRSLIQIIARTLCKNLNTYSAGIIINLYKKIQLEDYDLIVAAGGKTAPIVAAIKHNSNIPAVQLGSPRGSIHASLFNALVTVEKYFNHHANVVTDITPNLYSPEICSLAAKNKNLSDHILFLIGGQGIGYSYSAWEWESLILNILSINEKTRTPISIVTSRRTDPLVEKKLETQLSEINTRYSAWFHKGDKNFNLDALFGSAKKIFVTEDSAMMISESISSGKPVSTLYPSKIKSPARYRKHIQKYEDLKYIIRQSIESFSVDFDSDAKNRIEAHHRDLLKIISVKINW
jgi:hypothetical protein